MKTSTKNGFRIAPITPFLIKVWFPLLMGVSIVLFAGTNWLAWLICTPMIVLLVFMVTLAQVRRNGSGMSVKRFFWWKRFDAAQVQRVGPSFLKGIGFVQLNRFVFPWGRIYFQMDWSENDLVDVSPSAKR
jgi:hypothetical protein